MKNEFDFNFVSNLIDEGHISKGLMICTEAVKKDINNTDALLLIGRAYAYLGEYTKSLIYLSNALEKVMSIKKQIRIYREFIEIYSMMKRYDYALHYCNKIIQLNPEDVDYMFTKTLLLYKCQRFHEALIALNTLKRNDILCSYKEDAEVLYHSIKSFLA